MQYHHKTKQEPTPFRANFATKKKSKITLMKICLTRQKVLIFLEYTSTVELVCNNIGK